MSGRSTNYTAELRKFKAEGAKIVCQVKPYEDQEVVYVPRNPGDPKPWRLMADPDGYRYSGRECTAVTPNGGGPWALARVLKIGAWE